jgi:hypothetical protein
MILKIKKNPKLLNTLFIFLLIILLIYFASNFVKKNKYKEGFSIPGIDDMVKGLDEIENIATKIPQDIQGIGKDITNSVDSVKDVGAKITSEIDNTLTEFLKDVENLVVNKITSFFTQFGNILYKGIINPLIVLFEGIGGIFTAVFGILTEIVDKIITLPKCILIYAITSFFNVIREIYTSIFPVFLTNIIGKVYDFIIDPPLSWFLALIGYTDASNKCYKFDVNSKIDNMEHGFSNIDKVFKNDFGKLDFGSIKL